MMDIWRYFLVLTLLPMGVHLSQSSFKSAENNFYHAVEIDQTIKDLEAPASFEQSIDLQLDLPTDLQSFYQIQFLKLIVGYPERISVKRISFYLLDIPPPAA